MSGRGPLACSSSFETVPCRLESLGTLAEWVATGVGMLPLELQRECFSREGGLH